LPKSRVAVEARREPVYLLTETLAEHRRILCRCTGKTCVVSVTLGT
jgi:hypothetical protein